MFALAPESTVGVTVSGLDGSPAATFSVARDGDVLTARFVDGAATGWSVLLDGVHEIVGDRYESTPRGVRLHPDGGQVVARLR